MCVSNIYFLFYKLYLTDSSLLTFILPPHKFALTHNLKYFYLHKIKFFGVFIIVVVHISFSIYYFFCANDEMLLNSFIDIVVFFFFFVYILFCWCCYCCFSCLFLLFFHHHFFIFFFYCEKVFGRPTIFTRRHNNRPLNISFIFYLLLT